MREAFEEIAKMATAMSTAAAAAADHLESAARDKPHSAVWRELKDALSRCKEDYLLLESADYLVVSACKQLRNAGAAWRSVMFGMPALASLASLDMSDSFGDTVSCVVQGHEESRPVRVRFFCLSDPRLRADRGGSAMTRFKLAAKDVISGKIDLLFCVFDASAYDLFISRGWRLARFPRLGDDNLSIADILPDLSFDSGVRLDAEFVNMRSLVVFSLFGAITK